MSGGHFDYLQKRFYEIYEPIEHIIQINGQEKSQKELKEEYRDSDWYKKYPEDKFHHKYKEKVIKEFKKGVEIIKLAEIYANRIDYLLCGDDGEESFLRRLKEELCKK